MTDYSEVFVGIDTSKLRNAVAIAEGGRNGEVRYLGEIDNTEAATSKLVKKLAAQHRRLTFCYEAGPTGYGLHRLIKTLGHECVVVAPSLIPKKPGDRVKSNRRDALNLAKLLRGRTDRGLGSGCAARGDAGFGAGARSCGRRSQIQTPAGPVAAAAAWPAFYRQANLDQGPYELASEPEACPQRTAYRLRGDAVGGAASRRARDPARAGDRRGGAGLVACSGGDGTDGGARSRSHFGYDFPRRDRRPVALCQPAPVDGLSRPGAG